MNEYNYEIAREMIVKLPTNKREQLEKQRDRNFNFTSSANLEDVVLIIFKEGFELICSGCRTQFKCFYKDNDGVLECTRKPKNATYIYTDSFKVSDDFYNN